MHFPKNLSRLNKASPEKKRSLKNMHFQKNLHQKEWFFLKFILQLF